MKYEIFFFTEKIKIIKNYNFKDITYKILSYIIQLNFFTVKSCCFACFFLFFY